MPQPQRTQKNLPIGKSKYSPGEGVKEPVYHPKTAEVIGRLAHIGRCRDQNTHLCAYKQERDELDERFGISGQMLSRLSRETQESGRAAALKAEVSAHLIARDAAEKENADKARQAIGEPQ